MKPHSILLSGLLLLAPLSSCADGSTDNTAKQVSKILDSGDILTISTDKTSASASYFSTSPADRTQLANRMLNILKKTNASNSIISFAESRLKQHPRLKRDNFKVPLTDKDGTVYKFTYISDANSRLYLLNYQCLGATKN